MITTRALGAAALVVDGWTVNCTGTYNPCTEVLKAKGAGQPIPKTLSDKCAAFQAKCGKGGDTVAAAKSIAAFKAGTLTRQTGSLSSIGQLVQSSPTTAPGTATGTAGISATPSSYQTIDPTTGLPATVDPTTGMPATGIADWVSANKTTIGVGAAIILGAILIVKLL